ncbi:MAG: S8 family serine peptidase [Desulfotomaculum sp.]|nr:S8 family serine peptidase [Desulfotomaculum sp.]
MMLRKKLVVLLCCLLSILLILNAAWAGQALPENDVSAVVLGAPLVWNNPDFIRNGLGLSGSGQIIGAADTGLGTGVLDTLHPDLRNRVIDIVDYSGDGADDPFGHGTHIAASIAGSGAESGRRLKGIAPDASLYFQAAYNEEIGSLKIPGIYELLEDAYAAGARIHSNSWGYSESRGEYDRHASSLDKFVWEHPDMLVLKSAGNYADGELWYVTSPGAAKNAIVVGAAESPRGIDADSDNPYQVASFSSRGTSDGRIKPDLVAPGTWVLSASRNKEEKDGYSYLSGTSMATAMAAGAAALTRQYFTDIKNVTPSAALVKAALIHGARELPGEPRVSQGFGLIDLQASIMALEDSATAFYDKFKIKDDQVLKFQIKVKSGAPLRATLVWTDYPQRPGAAKALVNDLDLKITVPDGRVLWGNNFIGGDNKNNVEVITIHNTADGVYTIEVRGSKIAEGPQPFSLIYGQVPLRGEIKFDGSGGKRIVTAGGEELDLDPETPVKLVKNSRYEGSVLLKDIPVGTNIYYLPRGEQRQSDKLEAVYDLAYAALRSRLPVQEPVEFKDTGGHWAEEVIDYMSRVKVLSGYPDGTFRPNAKLTRAQFAAMLVRALKLVESPADAAVFRDVPADAWYRGAVGAAVSARLVAGYSEHTFGPNDPITREQMAVMIARAVSGGLIPYHSGDKTLEKYSDLEEISLWARPSVSMMVKYGIVNGRAPDRFIPQGTTTRAEAAAVLKRMMDMF